MTRSGRKPDLARAFGGAAASYEAHAPVQRRAAEQLAARIVALDLPRPLRVLEIGCGTGFLTRALRRHLPEATIIATDLAPAMVAACRAAARNATGEVAEETGDLHVLAMDGERPAVAPGFGLICASLAFQWFEDLPAALRRLAALLAPGGVLACATLAEGSLAEWEQAHAAAGLQSGLLRFPTAEALRAQGLTVGLERIVQPFPDGMTFLRDLRRIGAHRPRAGTRPLGPGALRRVLEAFAADGATASYEVAYCTARRPGAAGVFVTGTDTGVGKTLVSACLARAWGAEYWKPVQTGLAEEAGDTPTVLALAGLPPERLHPPVHALAAPLSPEAAGALEGVRVDLAGFRLPAARRPLVVEGAGGVLVPVNETDMMLDLMERLGLPAVLVARSGLGTLNHTLLSLGALRARGVPVLGVVLNGPVNPGNREAIERHGQVRVIAEIPPLPEVTPARIAEAAARIPPLAELLAASGPFTSAAAAAAALPYPPPP
ncbi:MAG TPA: dethiobiotin synthase [Acetobacteraceae bacterium]|nr:dethiobiotin synthase [Acetobacteraceae bacterium]